MIADQNKDIHGIIYNHLNLPVQITFSGTTNGTISYLYNALGQKVKKMVNNGVSVNTDYLSGFQYQNEVLDFFPHAEGYVKATEMMVFMGGRSYGFNYVFNYTDHLGNIRLSYSKDPSTQVLKIIEENHYYPFGLKHTGYNSDAFMYAKDGSLIRIRPVPPLFTTSYDYKYNGKELQEELGLNTYSYGWREYDPAIGKFNRLDRFSEKYYDKTPYGYAGNNPVIFNDIQGDSIRVAKLIDFDKVTKGNMTQKVIKDLSSITGLNVSVNETTGLVEYQKDADGNAVIRETDCTQEGSSTARTDLLSMINGPLVEVWGGRRSITAGNEIALSPTQIDSFINGTPSELDNRTMGYGMVLMHEFRHTNAGGGFSDPKDPEGMSTGDVVNRVNIYRKELDNNPTTSGSGQFGQRSQYFATPGFTTTKASINFQYQTLNKRGKTVNKSTQISFTN